MAPAPAAKLSGYSGYYARQLALMDQKQTAGSTAAAAVANSKTTVAATSSATSTTEHKSTTTVEKSSKIDTMKEFQASLQYGKQSRSQALRRAEVHALKSGNDPRHTLVPRNMDDDICKKVADIHMTDYERVMSQQGRQKVDKLEKELSHLTSSAMTYKSV